MKITHADKHTYDLQTHRDKKNSAQLHKKSNTRTNSTS